MSKLILCLDFDGVIHSYSSGWQEADFIPDPPVPGALEFIHKAMDKFEVVIFSSRSGQDGGIRAMQNWLRFWSKKIFPELAEANKIINVFCMGNTADEHRWPITKPPAFVTLDDRALTFDGNWPELSELEKFKPWNKV